MANTAKQKYYSITPDYNPGQIPLFFPTKYHNAIYYYFHYYYHHYYYFGRFLVYFLEFR